MNYIGIDISKQNFDVAIAHQQGHHHYKFENNEKGFKQLLGLIDKQLHWCVMEASGPYYLKLATYLDSNGVAVSVVNPLVIRRFCQMRLVKAKTDKKDAVMIARYGQSEKPQRWSKAEDYILELRQLQAVMEQLEKSVIAFNNQLEALTHSPLKSKAAGSRLTGTITNLKKQIEATERDMEQIINEHNKEMFERLKTIPGIGPKTSILLIVISGGFAKFQNAKQVSSYVGLSPRIFESGTSVKGKARICKMGMGRIRKLLYLCSWSAIKYNGACRQLYERLIAKGKPKMVALIAVANKLLKQAFAIVKKKSNYQKNYSMNPCF